MPPVETLPIVPRRAARLKRVQKAQHLLGALILLTAGYNHLQVGHHGVLPLAEIAAALFLIGSVIVERVRQRHRAHGHALAWVELAGAVMVFVEAIAKLEQPHHLSFYVLSFVQPLILLTFALFDAQIAAVPRLTADDEHFTMRTRLFFRTRLAWSEMRSWKVAGDAIEVTTRGGHTKRLSFGKLVDSATALNWSRQQFERRARSAPGELPGGESGADQSQRDQQPVPVEK